MITLAALSVALTPQAVEVPFRMGENAIIADVTVNGRNLSLMFDTGFGGAVVVDDTVNLGPSNGSVTLTDFVGPFQASTVDIKTLKVGPMKIDAPDLKAVEMPSAHSSFAYNAHVDGILGLLPMEGTPFEINFQNHKFIFHPQSYDISKLTPNNKTTFLLKMLPMGPNAVVLPVSTESGQKMHMSLDTGNAFFATTHKDVLERVGLWEKGRQAKFMKSSFVASGETASWEKKFTNMTIYGVPVPTSYWDVIELPAASAEGDGTVGIRFLKNFNITLDYYRRRVWLENFTGKVGNEAEGQVGIVAIGDRRGGHVIVRRVAPDSPAAKAGVKINDAVLSVDGTELRPTLTYRQIAALLNGEPGTKVDLALSREGQLLRMQIERVALYNE